MDNETTLQSARQPLLAPTGAPAPPREPSRLYISVAAKFWIAALFTIAWLALSIWLCRPWLHDLAAYVTTAGAIVIVTLVAYIPALLMSFMAMSLLLDRQPALRVAHPTTGVTIVIAARNEEAGIAETIRHAVHTDYDGPVALILADNGSTDATCVVARRTAQELDVDLHVVHELKPGKA